MAEGVGVSVCGCLSYTLYYRLYINLCLPLFTSVPPPTPRPSLHGPPSIDGLIGETLIETLKEVIPSLQQQGSAISDLSDSAKGSGGNGLASSMAQMLEGVQGREQSVSFDASEDTEAEGWRGGEAEGSFRDEEEVEEEGEGEREAVYTPSADSPQKMLAAWVRLYAKFQRHLWAAKCGRSQPLAHRSMAPSYLPRSARSHSPAYAPSHSQLHSPSLSGKTPLLGVQGGDWSASVLEGICDDDREDEPVGLCGQGQGHAVGGGNGGNGVNGVNGGSGGSGGYVAGGRLWWIRFVKPYCPFRLLLESRSCKVLLERHRRWRASLQSAQVAEIAHLP
jgi:hypothetical protein